MTEDEWSSCTDPMPMLEFLRGRGSERKLRLFACACARRACAMDVDEQREAVEIAESYADGLVGSAELKRVLQSLPTWFTPRLPVLRPALSAAKRTAVSAADLQGWRIPSNLPPWTPAHVAARAAERDRQCVVLRDIFGNPFQPVAVDSGWMTPSVVEVARSMYQGRAFDRMPVLADTLERAGYTNDEMLAHCRQPREHVRGCWVVDLILGKK